MVQQCIVYLVTDPILLESSDSRDNVSVQNYEKKIVKKIFKTKN